MSVHKRKIKEIKKDHQFETLALEKSHKAGITSSLCSPNMKRVRFFLRETSALNNNERKESLHKRFEDLLICIYKSSSFCVV